MICQEVTKPVVRMFDLKSVTLDDMKLISSACEYASRNANVLDHFLYKTMHEFIERVLKETPS